MRSQLKLFPVSLLVIFSFFCVFTIAISHPPQAHAQYLGMDGIGEQTYIGESCYIPNSNQLGVYDAAGECVPNTSLSGSCYNLNGAFSQTAGISISEGPTLCPPSTQSGWSQAYLDGVIPLAPAAVPTNSNEPGGCDWIVSSTDYQLIIGDGDCNAHGDVGDINDAMHLNTLILTPPFHFNTTSPALQAAYQTALNTAIASSGKMIFTIGTTNITIPVGVPAAPKLYGYNGTTTVDLYGAGFSETQNTVIIENEASATIDTISNLSSSFDSSNTNDSYLEFTLPAYITDTPGIYFIKASAYDSLTPYSNPITLNLLSTTPSDLTATLTTAQVGTTTTAKVVLSWQASTVGVREFIIETNGMFIISTTSDDSSFIYTGTTTSFTYTDPEAGFYQTLPAYRVRAVYNDGTYSPYSNIASTSPTQCYSVEGNGPDSIVFMKGTSLGNAYPINYYLTLANNIINNTFDGIDPFKTYFNQFSFYIDFNYFNDYNYTQNYNTANSLAAGSSCGGNDKDYIFLNGNNNNNINPAVTYHKTFGVANAASISEINITHFSTLPITDIHQRSLFDVIGHETGHAIGLLSDEYADGSTTDDFISDQNIVNCVANPSVGFVSTIDNQWYGAASSTATKGCGGNVSPNAAYYRPSSDSIMYLETVDPMFNIISCGDVIAGILNVDAPYPNLSIADRFNVKKVAQQFWPRCHLMATADPPTVTGLSELPPRTPAPTLTTLKVNGVSTNNISAGDPTITGTNFSTTTTNDVHLINTASSSEFYDITAPASPDGTTLSFIMPTGTSSIPLGTYTLQVGGFNSPYSSSMTVHVVAPPPLTLSWSPLETSATLSWTGSVSSTTGYDIYETSPAATTTLLGATTASTLSYTLTNLEPQTQYCALVVAVKSNAVAGKIAPPGGWGTTNIATSTPLCTTTATAPLPVLTQGTTSSSTVLLSWSDSDPSATNYTLAELTPATTTLYSGTATTYTLTSLTPAITYCASVTVSNKSLVGVGLNQSWVTTVLGTSLPLCVSTASTSSSTPPLLTPAPASSTPPILSVVGSSPQTLALEWTDSDKTVIGYTLSETSPSPITIATINQSRGSVSYVFSGLTPTTNYCLVVSATNASGTVTTSAPTCATTPAEPRIMGGGVNNINGGKTNDTDDQSILPVTYYLASVWSAIVGWVSGW